MPKSVARYAEMSLLAPVEGENIFTLFKVAYNPECVSPEQVPDRIRAIVRGWGQGPAGRRAKKETGGDFNWGDLAHWAPAIHWRDGILSVEAPVPHALHIVSHDERLLDSEPSDQPASGIASQEKERLIQVAQVAYSGFLLDNPNDYLAEIILSAIESASSANSGQTAAEIVAGTLESDAGELEQVAQAFRDHTEHDIG